MENWHYVVVVLCIPVFLFTMFLSVIPDLRHRKNTVRYPAMLVILSGIWMGLSLIGGFFAVSSDRPFFSVLVCLSGFLLGLFLFLLSVRFRITYDDDGFTHHPLFGAEKRYTYHQITGIHVFEEALYLDGRRFGFDPHSFVGGDEFLDIVKAQYAAHHDGAALPRQRDEKGDPYNGNVKDGRIFFYAIFIIVIIALAGFLFALSHCIMPANEKTCSRDVVVFVDYAVSDREILLLSADTTVYALPYTGDLQHIQPILQLCRSNNIVTVYSTKSLQDSPTPRFTVKSIVSDDQVFLSFREGNRLHRQNTAMIVFLSAIPVLLFAAIFVSSVTIGRHPERYSLFVFNLLFRTRYHHYTYSNDPLLIYDIAHPDSEKC